MSNRQLFNQAQSRFAKPAKGVEVTFSAKYMSDITDQILNNGGMTEALKIRCFGMFRNFDTGEIFTVGATDKALNAVYVMSFAGEVEINVMIDGDGAETFERWIIVKDNTFTVSL